MPGIEQTEFSGHSNEICNAPATSIMYDNRTRGYGVDTVYLRMIVRDGSGIQRYSFPGANVKLWPNYKVGCCYKLL